MRAGPRAANDLTLPLTGPWETYAAAIWSDRRRGRAGDCSRGEAAVDSHGNQRGCRLPLLDRSIPNLEKAQEAFKLIAAVGHRAGEVIESIRTALRNDVRDRTSLDVNELIREAIALEHDDLHKYQISVHADHATTGGAWGLYPASVGALEFDHQCHWRDGGKRRTARPIRWIRTAW